MSEPTPKEKKRKNTSAEAAVEATETPQVTPQVEAAEPTAEAETPVVETPQVEVETPQVTPQVEPAVEAKEEAVIAERIAAPVTQLEVTVPIKAEGPTEVYSPEHKIFISILEQLVKGAAHDDIHANKHSALKAEYTTLIQRVNARAFLLAFSVAKDDKRIYGYAKVSTPSGEIEISVNAAL